MAASKPGGAVEDLGVAACGERRSRIADLGDVETRAVRSAAVGAAMPLTRRRVQGVDVDQDVGLCRDGRGRGGVRALARGRAGVGRGLRADGVEGVDHVLGVGLGQLEHVGPAVGEEAGRWATSRYGGATKAARGSPGDVEEVALGQGVVDGQVADGGTDETVDGERVGDGRVHLVQHGAEEGILALDPAEVGEAVVLPVAVRVLVVQVPAAHQLQCGPLTTWQPVVVTSSPVYWSLTAVGKSMVMPPSALTMPEKPGKPTET